MLNSVINRVLLTGLVASIFLLTACSSGGQFPEEHIAENGQLYFTFEGDASVPWTWRGTSFNLQLNSLKNVKYRENICRAAADERGYEPAWCAGEDYLYTAGHLKMRCKCELKE